MGGLKLLLRTSLVLMLRGTSSHLGREDRVGRGARLVVSSSPGGFLWFGTLNVRIEMFSILLSF